MLAAAWSLVAGAPAFATTGTASMGNDQLANPGDWLSAGYHLKQQVSGATVSAVGPSIVFTFQCPNGSPGGTFNLALPTRSYATTNDWVPVNSNVDPSTYQGALTVPDVCKGGQVKVHAGTFTADIRSTNTSVQVTFGFHYVVAAAKTKTHPGPNCSSTTQNPSPGISACQSGWSGNQNVTPSAPPTTTTTTPPTTTTPTTTPATTTPPTTSGSTPTTSGGSTPTTSASGGQGSSSTGGDTNAGSLANGSSSVSGSSTSRGSSSSSGSFSSGSSSGSSSASSNDDSAFQAPSGQASPPFTGTVIEGTPNSGKGADGQTVTAHMAGESHRGRGSSAGVILLILLLAAGAGTGVFLWRRRQDQQGSVA
jgi:hypothetical protein